MTLSAKQKKPRRHAAARHLRRDESHASSLRSLARKLGRPASTVQGWAHRPDWPFGSKPPYPVAEVAVWARAAESENPERAYRREAEAIQPEQATDGIAHLSVINKAKLKILLERARIYKLAADEKEGRLHDTAACRQRRLRQIHAVRAALVDLPRLLGPQLEGQPRLRIEQMLDDRLRGILGEFAAGDEPPAPEKPDA